MAGNVAARKVLASLCLPSATLGSAFVLSKQSHDQQQLQQQSRHVVACDAAAPAAAESGVFVFPISTSVALARVLLSVTPRVIYFNDPWYTYV